MVVTTGAAGAFAAAGSGVVSVEAEPVDVIDTVGAGDTFMGALIDGLLRSGYRDASARQDCGPSPPTNSRPCSDSARSPQPSPSRVRAQTRRAVRNCQ